MSPSPQRIAPGDHVGLCLDVDGTVHPHGSIFVEALALLPYASDLPIGRADRDALRDVLGTVAAYAGGDRSRRRWLAALTGADAIARLGLSDAVARVLAWLVRYRARRASDASPSGTGAAYRDMQRRVLDSYGEFLEGRRRDRVERAFERVVGTHLRADAAIRRTIAALGAVLDLEVLLVTDVPTHVARPYGNSIGEGVDVVGTDFPTTDGQFTGEYTLVEKGAAVERERVERGWDYTIAAGDSATDLPMAGSADVFLAVSGRGNVGDELPADYRTVEMDALRSGRLPIGTDVVCVPDGTSVTDALRTTIAALGVEIAGANESNSNESGRQPDS